MSTWTGDGTPAGLRAAHGRGARRPTDPPLVHRRARPAQVVRHLARRARERLRGGHAVRRVVHRRLQPGAGERRARPPDPNSFELLPWGDRRRAVGPHVLRHRQPRRLALRGRSSAGAASATSTGPARRASRSTSRPEMEFFYFADRRPESSRRSRSTRRPTSTSPPPTSPATSASARSTRSRRWASRSSTRTTRTRRASTRSTCATPTR